MTGALGGFDPKATYDDASRDYEDASRDFWQYLSFRTVERLRLQPGERVLDVPCGTGPALMAAAERVGPTGRVVGLDYADRMLAIAREKVRASGVQNVEVHIGDMTAIAPPEKPYDVTVQAVSKHLKVLEDAGLVSRTREAQRRPVHLEAEVFDLMTKWLERYRRQAEERYRRLDDVLRSMPDDVPPTRTSQEGTPS